MVRKNTKLDLVNMKINITQEDLDLGKRYHCKMCPVALALQRAGIEVSSVGKYVFSYYVTNTAESIRLKTVGLPPTVTSFIAKFDKGERTEPFEFEIELTK